MLLRPLLISSIVNTPSPFTSNYLNNFPNSEISFSPNYEAIKVNATFFNLWCWVKFLRMLKFNDKFFLLFFRSDFNHAFSRIFSAVRRFETGQIIFFIRSFACSETPSNSGISNVYSPSLTASKIF